MSYPQTPTHPACHQCGQPIGDRLFYQRGGYVLHTTCRAAFDSPAILRGEGFRSTRRYYVVNTETGADVAGPFDDLAAAQAEMYRLYPLAEPFTEEIPIAIDERIAQ